MERGPKKEKRRLQEKIQRVKSGKPAGGGVNLSTTPTPINTVNQVPQINPERDKETEEDRITELLNHFDLVNTTTNVSLIKSFWDGENTIEEVASQINVNASELQRAALPCVALTFEENNNTIKALFDSGAGVSLIKSTVLNSLHASVESCNLTLRLANNKTTNVTKKASINCIVGDKIGTITFLVADELSYDAMLGNDFINAWKVEPCFHKGTYTFADSEHDFPFVYHRFVHNDVNAVDQVEPRVATKTSVIGKVQPKGTYSMKKGDPKIRFGQNPFKTHFDSTIQSIEDRGQSAPLPSYRHPLQRLSDVDPMDEVIQRMSANKPKVGFTHSNISKQLGRLYGITDTRHRPCVVPSALFDNNMINPCNFSYSETESAGELSDDEHSEYDSSINSDEDLDVSEDAEDEDYIPFFNYPYKSSSRPNCTVNNNKPVQISSDVLECLLQCEEGDFQKRVLNCLKNKMTNVTVLDLESNLSEDDDNYNLSNYHLLDKEGIQILKRREIKSFLNCPDKWIEIYLKGPEYQLTNAFPVIGEELVANLKHIEYEFNMYNELEKLGSCKNTCNDKMGEGNRVRMTAHSQINMLDNILDSQSKMGEPSPGRVLDQVNTIGEANKTAVKPPIQYDVNKEFPLFKDLIDLCDEYPEVLNNGIGRYNGTDIQFKLETKEDALPVRHYPFKMPEDKWRVLREQIAVHIACGRIQPSQSAWASRAFLVSKKDAQTIDDWRLVIDYREFNDLTKLFPFPSPDSDYIMSSMAGAQYFSGIDIHSAFHQIPCADKET